MYILQRGGTGIRTTEKKNCVRIECGLILRASIYAYVNNICLVHISKTKHLFHAKIEYRWRNKFVLSIESVCQAERIPSATAEMGAVYAFRPQHFSGHNFFPRIVPNALTMSYYWINRDMTYDPNFTPVAKCCSFHLFFSFVHFCKYLNCKWKQAQTKHKMC